MSSLPLTACPNLPPTTNTLNSQQRSRLLRSTRKLGAVLGTTPYLLESDTSFVLLPLGKTASRALKRQGSIFTHHQSSSLSVSSTSTSTFSSHRPSPSASTIAFPPSVAPSAQPAESLPPNPPGLSTTRGKRLGDKGPKLYLRLDTVSVSPTDDRVTLSLPPTPCTPSPPTPTTPVVPTIAETRRKRMAKLARHLGENIPSELVFPSEPNTKSASVDTNPRTRRRSQSVHVMPTQAMSPDSRPIVVRSKQDWVGEWNRANIKDVQKELRNLRIR